MKKYILFLLIITSFYACNKGEAMLEERVAGEILASSEADFSKMEEPPAPPPPPQVDQVKFVKPVVANAEEVTQDIEQKIIKEGNLRYETSDLEATFSQIQSALEANKAKIENDNAGKDDNTLYRRLLIRVPSKNFDSFLKTISKGVSYFDTKEVSSRDVTTEYIDIDARLKAKKTLENRYLELLKKATKVSEILEIEAQLSAIREEIDSKQGQMNYLQNQVSFSTINIEFYKTVAPDSGATISYGSKIWNAFKSGFNSFSSFFVSLISVWPFLIIIGGLGYFIRKRFTKKTV